MVFSQTFKAISMMVVAVFLIAVMNAGAKSASTYHDPIEIVFYRGVLGLLILTAWLFITRRFDLLKTTRPFAQMGRALCGNISVVLVFWAYALMPMTEVTALMLSNGFIITILSAMFLKEYVGPYRWSAVAVGLLGALIVAQPQGHNFNPLGVTVALTAAFSTALVVILLRSLGKTEHTFTTVFYFVLTGTIGSGIYVILNGSLPHPDATIAILVTCVAGLIALVIKTESYRIAEASLLTPYHYLSVVWAALLGWAVFKDVPTPAVIIGSALIVLSNLVIIWRERVLAIRRKVDSPPV
jgi:drug/metabolite transporter (DMT)-like permease